MQRPSRILAVDDNPVNLAVLGSLLADYTVQMAESGVHALDIAPRFRPDVVLLDIIMPEIDGYTTCRRMRGNPSLRHTKIIMVSAKSELNERLAGYDAGADDYIAKPYDGDELLAKIRVYLKLKSVEEIEEVKNRTIEVLQHSNRTPLTNIISYAELLTCGAELEDEMRAEAPKVILQNARRLHQLLKKGETLAGMKSGQFAFCFQPGDVSDIVRKLLEELAPAAADRHLQLISRLPPSVKAVFDQEQLRFAIHALLDNAIRLSHDGGTVAIDLQTQEDTLALSVADEGAGISDQLLPRVFQPFGNPDSPLLNCGDGLSLAIVQQIAWAHEGDIHVESDLGRGATFTLRIPLGAQDELSDQEWAKAADDSAYATENRYTVT